MQRSGEKRYLIDSQVFRHIDGTLHGRAITHYLQQGGGDGRVIQAPTGFLALERHVADLYHDLDELDLDDLHLRLWPERIWYSLSPRELKEVPGAYDPRVAGRLLSKQIEEGSVVRHDDLYYGQAIALFSAAVKDVALFAKKGDINKAGRVLASALPLVRHEQVHHQTLDDLRALADERRALTAELRSTKIAYALEQRKVERLTAKISRQAPCIKRGNSRQQVSVHAFGMVSLQEQVDSLQAELAQATQHRTELEQENHRLNASLSEGRHPLLDDLAIKRHPLYLQLQQDLQEVRVASFQEIEQVQKGHQRTVRELRARIYERDRRIAEMQDKTMEWPLHEDPRYLRLLDERERLNTRIADLEYLLEKPRNGTNGAKHPSLARYRLLDREGLLGDVDVPSPGMPGPNVLAVGYDLLRYFASEGKEQRRADLIPFLMKAMGSKDVDEATVTRRFERIKVHLRRIGIDLSAADRAEGIYRVDDFETAFALIEDAQQVSPLFRTIQFALLQQKAAQMGIGQLLLRVNPLSIVQEV